MSSFARKRNRKIKKQAMTGDEKAVKKYVQAMKSVKQSYVDQYRNDMLCRKQALRNLSGCFLLAMNKGYGFGRDKLLQLRDKMQSEMDAIIDGYVSIEDIAGYLREDIGVDVGIEAKNPDKGHYRQIEFKAVQQMSAAFLMALLDEFSFKKKRLSDAYGWVTSISEEVGNGNITYSEIHAEVDKIMSRKRRKAA